MLNVVFTGPATDSSNRPVIRRDLVAAVEAKGFTVQGSIRTSTTILVASRIDTVKAKSARDRKLTVTTYAAFIDAVLGGEVPKCEATAPNKYTDHAAEKPFSDVFTEKDIL